MTTAKEKEVLNHIVAAFNSFCRLNKEDLCHPDDLSEFKDAIHRLQLIMAYRVARRADPETWGGTKEK